MKEIKDISRWKDILCGLEESILSKWLYYPRQSTDSMQSLSNYQWNFSQNCNKKFQNLYGDTKDSKEPKQSWKWKMELEESGSLTSDYNTKLMSSKRYGTGTKIEIQINGTDRKPQNQPMHLWSIQFSCSIMSNSLRLHGLQHARPPCPSPIRRVYSNSCSLSWWCHPIILSSVTPFPSRLSIFPNIRVLSNESVLCIRWPKYRSFSWGSVLPMNIQEWFLLGLTHRISL